MPDTTPNSDEVVAWLKQGFDAGFCSDVGCDIHMPDTYLTVEEMGLRLDGEEVCATLVRIYGLPQTH